MKNFNHSFTIISRLLETDNTKRETNRYRNIYNCNKRNMNTKERTKHQINIRELDSNRYRKKNIIKLNSNRMNKNRKINK